MPCWCALPRQSRPQRPRSCETLSTVAKATTVNLYVAAAGLILLAAVLLGPLSTVMANAQWVDRAPRAGVAVWQAIGASSLLAGIGSGLCVAVERYHSGFLGGLSQVGHGVVSGRPLAGLGLLDALGLTLAVDLAFVFCCMLGAVTMRTVMTRRHHRRLVDLLALRTLETGASVLDHTTRSPTACQAFGRGSS